jgi:hypothetical protein
MFTPRRSFLPAMNIPAFPRAHGRMRVDELTLTAGN